MPSVGWHFARSVAMKSTGLPQYPKQLTQTNDKTCAHTCLAMVTGLDVADIVSVFGDVCGMSDHDAMSFLSFCGVVAERLPSGYYPDRWSVFFATIPSLNIENSSHRVVLYWNSAKDAWVVLDPNKGRKGKRLYTAKRYLSHSPEAYSFMRLTKPRFPIREINAPNN